MFDTKGTAMRLRATGLKPSQAHELTMLIQKWIKCSGEEWTVERIKAIKLDLLHHFAGIAPVKCHSWIRYDANGFPKGPFRAIFRLARRSFHHAWNVMMVYTGLVYSHPDLRVTPRQWKKMEAAIRRTTLSSDALVESITVVHTTPFSIQPLVVGTSGNPLVDYQVSPTRRAPKDFQTVPEVEAVIDSLRPLLRRTTWSVRNWDILSGTVRGLENSIVPDLERNLEDDRRAGGEPSDEDERPEMGLISLIQEGGYKLRFAANPYRVYQMALQPLGSALFEALRRVPNDFTFDQTAGVDFIQRLLTLGLPAVSMDLSNATDHAPLDAQLAFLSRWGVHTRWIQFLESTCRGDWYTKVSKSSPWRNLRWTVGSPLGLYPTFATFALWHHAVVQDCFQSLGKPKVDGLYPYAIVGDDLFIGDNEVADLHQKRLESWGIPVSEHKTLRSNTTAEFVGRVITSNDVVQGIKWKGRVSDESFVDFARNIGPGALILMRPRQRKVISWIADLPEPLGLGWNPYGIPLDERLTPQIEQIWSRDERVRFFSRRAARSAQLLYMSSDKSGTPVPGREPSADVLTDDQSVAELLQYAFPGWNLGVPLWSNIPEVVRRRIADGELPPETAVKLRLMLQASSYVERRKEVPTLVVLERKIARAIARSR